jgi:hypothetical protein
VQQRHSLARSDQVHRHTIRNGYGKEDTGGYGDPAIDAFHLDPPASIVVDAHKIDPMHLIPQCERAKGREGAPEGEPSAHHLSHGLMAPETEIEASPRFRSTSGDAGLYAIPFPPAGDLEPGDCTGNR